MDRSPLLSRLEPLIGTWEMTITAGDSTFGGARLVTEWLESGAYLIQRTAPGAPDPAMPAIWRDNSPLPTVTVIGLDDTAETFTALYSDARGVSRVYAMTLADGVWTLHRAAPGFNQRFRATLAPDTIAGAWEMSTDGTTWNVDFHLTYTRLG